MTTSVFTLLVLAFALILQVAYAHDHDHKFDNHVMTCGSTVKLNHFKSQYQLFSAGVNYGSGSREQVVTATPPDQSQPSNLFQLVSAYDPKDPDAHCAHGQPLKCGDTIRLKHVDTNTFVRMQTQHRSPLSHKDEVSSENRENRIAENFVIDCYNPKSFKLHNTQHNGLMYRDAMVKFRNTQTGKYLYANRQYEFNQHNCRGCPIQNHIEVSGHISGLDENTFWTFGDGYYVPLHANRVIYDYQDIKSQTAKVVYSAATDPLVIAYNKQHNAQNKNTHDEL
eukprot:UN00104